MGFIDYYTATSNPVRHGKETTDRSRAYPWPGQPLVINRVPFISHIVRNNGIMLNLDKVYVSVYLHSSDEH